MKSNCNVSDFLHRSRFLSRNREHLMHVEWLSTRLGSQNLFYEKKVLESACVFYIVLVRSAGSGDISSIR
jgi:hypothetical protein